MKMTIDIPDVLYRQAKIRAVETNGTLRELVMKALEREMACTAFAAEPVPYFSRRTLAPTFARLSQEGELRGGTDSSGSVSKERDAR